MVVFLMDDHFIHTRKIQTWLKTSKSIIEVNIIDVIVVDIIISIPIFFLKIIYNVFNSYLVFVFLNMDYFNLLALKSNGYR